MANLDTFQSDVLLGTVSSSDTGYNFEEATVTYTTGMRMGAALVLDAGKYIWVADAAAAVDCSAVLIDIAAEAYDGVELTTATDYTLVIAKRGCTINKNKLTTVDGLTPTIDLAAIAFVDAGANKVTDKVIGNQ